MRQEPKRRFIIASCIKESKRPKAPCNHKQLNRPSVDRAATMTISALQLRLLMPNGGLNIMPLLPNGTTVLFDHSGISGWRATTAADRAEATPLTQAPWAISWTDSFTRNARLFAVDLPELQLERIPAMPGENDGTQFAGNDKRSAPGTEATMTTSTTEPTSLIEQAHWASAQRRYDDAVTYWHEILQRSRQRGEPSKSALLHLGLSYRELGKLAPAESHFRQLVTLNHHARSWCELAVTLRQRAVQFIPDNVERADQYFDEANRAICVAEELNPKVARHYCEEALILLEMARLERVENDWQEAMNYYRDALEAVNDALAINGHSRNMSTKGIILSEMGGPYMEEGRQLLERGIARNRGRGQRPFVAAYHALIGVYQHLGNEKRTATLQDELQARTQPTASESINDDRDPQ